MAKEWYRGVSGVARKVTTPDRGVGGVARKVTKGYRGVSGVARQFFAAGTPLNTLPVGTTVYLNEGGTPVEYIIVHKGTPTYSSDDPSYNVSTYANDIQSMYVNCDGIWLLRKNCYPQTVQQGSHKNSADMGTVSSLMNDTILHLYDSGVQAAIHTVSLPYYDRSTATGEGTGLESDGIYSRSCGKLFPLSAKEVGFCNTMTGNDDTVDSSFRYIENEKREGFKLDYFEYTTEPSESGTTAANLRISDGRWWTRSGNCYSSVYMSEGLLITTSGQMMKRQSAGNVGSYYIYARPALVIDNNAVIDSDTMVVLGNA